MRIINLMKRISDTSIHIIGSTTTKGVALPYSVSMILHDSDNHKAFRRMMSEKFYHKDISIRISKYINEASIHFRNESDVAEFLLIAGE
jgi:hypothetical protein|tara:strand:+ start:345 stop:611 length:267 start_codon:yes stop_codon:yes gene_type:complete